MRRLKIKIMSAKDKALIYFFGLMTFLFTLVIFLNSAEIVLEVDIPYAYSLKKFEGSKHLDNTKLKRGEINEKSSLMQNYGDPNLIKFPSINKKLEVLKSIYNNGSYLVRTNKAHHLFDDKGNAIIYLHKSWQTVEDISKITIGENLYLDSDKGWRYVYRIEDLGIIDIDSTIVLPESEEPQLLVIIEDLKERKIYLIRSNYMTVINSQR